MCRAARARSRPSPPAASPPAAVQDHPCHQRRIVVHRAVAAAGQADQAGVRDGLLGADALAAQQEAVPAAPGDRDRQSGQRIGEADGVAGPQGRREARRLHQRPGLGHHGRGVPAGGAGVDGAHQRGAARRTAAEPLHHGHRQPLRDPPHRQQRREGVPPLGLRPESGGGQGGDGPYELLAPQLQREQAAQRVARDVRAVQLQRLEQGAQYGVGRGQVVAEGGRQRGGRAESGQVDRDHLALGGEDVHHRVPGLPMVPDAVQQDQWLAAPHARVGHGHVLGAARGRDGEGGGGGHGCSSARLLTDSVDSLSAITTDG